MQVIGNWLWEPHRAAEDEAVGSGLFFFFFHYEPGRKRNGERQRGEVRELQQITTPFNSIFTIRDLSAAIHSVQDDGDGVKGKASREMVEGNKEVWSVGPRSMTPWLTESQRSMMTVSPGVM